MIIFLTSRGHGYTVKNLQGSQYAPGLPDVRAMHYGEVFAARRLPRATYVFTDFERLHDWELHGAALLYRMLGSAGLRRLNDPAQMMTRYALLRALHAAGINPFTAYRAEDEAASARYPVFIRAEAAHNFPLTGLLADETALRAALARLGAEGWPLRQLLVIEYCAQPIAPDVWRKHGTLRIGEDIQLDRDVIEDNWIVKVGKKGIWTEAMFEDEADAIATRRYAEELRPAFEIAGIEYGRADHAGVDGRQVVYEINSNPSLTRGNKQVSALRDKALAQSALFVRDSLRKIDCAEAGHVGIDPVPFLPKRRWGPSLWWDFRD